MLYTLYSTFFGILAILPFLCLLPSFLILQVINCLSSSHPKHNRLYNSFTFREILLDYFSELFTGIRLSNCRLHRDWLFATAIDQHVVVERPETIPVLRYKYMHTYSHAFMYLYINTYIYIRKCIHTYIHTYLLIHKFIIF